MGFYESSDDYSDPSGAYVMHIKPGFRSTKVKEVKQMDSNTCQDLFVLYQSGLSYVARKWVISWLSVGYQWVIRGLSVGYQ